MTPGRAARAVRRAGSFLEESLRALPQFLLVRHFKAIEALLFLSVLVAAAYLLFQLFWGEPAAPAPDTAAQLELSKNTLDELELWIEESRAAFDTGLSLPAREYFVRGEAP